MYVVTLEASFCMVHGYCQIVEDSFQYVHFQCHTWTLSGNIQFQHLHRLVCFFWPNYIVHGKVYAVWTGITQIMKLTLAITIRFSHTLSILRILTQPFVVSFSISNKIMYPNFDMHCTSQHNTLESIFFVDVLE
jgi:hypothetical protein